MSFDAVLTTTIHVPTFFEGVCENAREHGHENIRFYVIGDHKTPAGAGEFCASMQKKFGLEFRYYDVPAQIEIVKGLPGAERILPYNWGGRKMLANILAYRDGAERLIMLDDDNFMTGSDFFGHYDVVGRESDTQVISSDSGWFNIYQGVVEEKSLPIFPRGYPWSERFGEDKSWNVEAGRGTIAALNGFVLGDPDIDAISRLFWPIRVSAMQPNFAPGFALAPGTWSSWNNQNTALSRAAAPAYFTPPVVGRNSDIWSAFVLCKLAAHFDEMVAFGEPLVEQVRNPHNLWVDLEDELPNNKANEYFLNIMRSAKLIGDDYLAVLASLIDSALVSVAESDEIPEDARREISGYFEEYRIWHGIMDSIQ
jgi:hypothetical protein